MITAHSRHRLSHWKKSWPFFIVFDINTTTRCLLCHHHSADTTGSRSKWAVAMMEHRVDHNHDDIMLKHCRALHTTASDHLIIDHWRRCCFVTAADRQHFYVSPEKLRCMEQLPAQALHYCVLLFNVRDRQLEAESFPDCPEVTLTGSPVDLSPLILW